MKHLKIIATMFIIVSLLGTSACSNKNVSTEKSEKTTLTYWSMYSKGEPQQKVIQHIINDYENAHPDVDVEVQWMGRKVLTKVRSAVLAKDAPDLVDKEFTELVATLEQRDMLEPLDPVLKKHVPHDKGEFKDIYKSGLLDMYKGDEGISLIPYQLISSGFFYDGKMFKQQNLKPPKTWDEFLELGSKLKSEGISPLVQDGNIDYYNAYYFYWLSERINGTGAFKEAAGDKTGNAWDNPGFLEAAKKVQELSKKDLFNKGFQGTQFPSAETAWAQGRAGMILNGSWIPNGTLEYSSDDFEYRTFPFPKVKGGEGDRHNVEVSLIGWAAPKGANVKAVEDYMAFAMQKKYQKEFVEKAKVMSPRKDVSAPEELKDVNKMIENKTGVHKPYDGVRGTHPIWWKMTFTPLDDKLIFGEITPEEFIKQLKKKSKEYWGK